MTDAGVSQRLADAPTADDPRKPASPDDLHKPAWKYVFRKAAREFTSDQCTDIAASLTYYAVLAIFPALIALISLLGVFGQSADAVIELLRGIAPASALEVIEPVIVSFSESDAAGFALVSGILVSIWSASGYVGAFSRAMNRVYEIDEGRTFLVLKPTQLLVTVVGVVLILVIALMLAVSGPITEAIGAALGLGDGVQLAWSILRWPVIAFILVLMVAILYYATPNAKQPQFRWISIGALVAIVMLVLASLAFAFYVATFANYDSTYGSLGGVIVFLLWIWIANIALLFGAEVDAEVERGRQLQAGIEAEDIQLPPRSTKKSAKAAKAEQKDIDDGRALRERASAEAEERERAETVKRQAERYRAGKR